jgi:hypothetical protein
LISREHIYSIAGPALDGVRTRRGEWVVPCSPVAEPGRKRLERRVCVYGR